MKIQKITSLILLLAFIGVATPMAVDAAPGSATIVSATTTLSNDADSNGIINVGDEITVDVIINNDEAGTTLIGNVVQYGGSSSESIPQTINNAGVGDEYQLVLTITDPNPNGIDVAASNAASQIDLFYTDTDDTAAALGQVSPTTEAVDTEIPTTVAGVSATAETDGSITLAWSANSDTDFDSYTLQRSTTSGSGFADLTTGVTATAYNDNTLTAGVTYYYLLNAVDDADNESANSAEVSATALAVQGSGGVAMAAYEKSSNSDDDDDQDDMVEMTDSDDDSDEGMATENEADVRIALLTKIMRSNMAMDIKITLFKLLAGMFN